MNVAKQELGSSGTETAALAFAGENNSTANLSDTESWNGTNWTNENTLNTARARIAGFGTQSLALAAGGTVSPNATEEWDFSVDTSFTVG
jgi:hypothetical protein